MIKPVVAPQWDAVLQAPFARLGVISDGQAIRQIVMLPIEGELLSPQQKHGAIRLLAQALADYWENPYTSALAEVPLIPAGTVFQQRVWQALSVIPMGSTLTYGTLAASLNTAAQAVGQACGANPLPILVPCHRVVARTGLGGFMGGRDVLEMNYKRWLLAHEINRAH